MPPRTQNSPCSSTGSSRVKPASTSCSASSCGPISTPAVRSTEAEASCAGGTSRGSSAAAEITTTRAWPDDDRRPARGRAWRRSAGEAPARDTDRPRATGQRHDGVGQRRFAKALERVEEVAGCRRSSPPRRRRRARRRRSARAARCWRAARRTGARAAGVRPETMRLSRSRPAFAAAERNNARRASELEDDTVG